MIRWEVYSKPLKPHTDYIVSAIDPKGNRHILILRTNEGGILPGVQGCRITHYDVGSPKQSHPDVYLKGYYDGFKYAHGYIYQLMKMLNAKL